ncbi:hypothetical protein [Nocardioides sp. B-3]|nr:hypothetical protein [Nocardioides sp. B-3]UUZ58241.1 hypothetical protein LP418_18585 [Nocardioides sp. B-3]
MTPGIPKKTATGAGAKLPPKWSATSRVSPLVTDSHGVVLAPSIRSAVE